MNKVLVSLRHARSNSGQESYLIDLRSEPLSHIQVSESSRRMTKQACLSKMTMQEGISRMGT